jgi:hypothetical protein
LRDAAAKAEREAQHRTAAEAALQTEIAGLRGTLAKSKQEAQEHAAAMQAEIVTLQRALDAARQVGKATVAAFRIDSAAPVKIDAPPGWRQAIKWFFGARTSFELEPVRQFDQG